MTITDEFLVFIALIFIYYTIFKLSTEIYLLFVKFTCTTFTLHVVFIGSLNNRFTLGVKII